MRCPYCREPLREESPECPSCRLDLKRAAKLLGALPRIESKLSDTTSALGGSEKKRILKRIDEIGYRFPQIRMQIVFRHFGDEHPLSLFTFWLFNLGGLSSASEKDAANHMILLVVDPLRSDACLMVGYGLEPFLSEDEVGSVLEMAEDSWIEKDWSGGIMLILDALESLLEGSAKRVAELFGTSFRKSSAAESLE